jgi:hypothetical protein
MRKEKINSRVFFPAMGVLSFLPMALIAWASGAVLKLF